MESIDGAGMHLTFPGCDCAPAQGFLWLEADLIWGVWLVTSVYLPTSILSPLISEFNCYGLPHDLPCPLASQWTAPAGGQKVRG